MSLLNISEDSSNNINNNNNETDIPWMLELDMEDSNWVMTSAFIIFTMQTGFGMLESGCVSVKNEVNIMMKNAIDVSLGGLTYWIFGFALSFGRDKEHRTPFFGWGDFCVNPSIDDPNMGPLFAAFIFQLSFATTATTIVSGAMAERCNFKAYCLFSLCNTIVYCIPAGWVWGEQGFLSQMGVVDIAGSGPVHLVGGVSAFASALMLGPRLGRYEQGLAPLPLGSPVNAVMGLFVLWWGWLAFNSGSTYGVSGAKWIYAARAAVMTMISSFGGGTLGLVYSMLLNRGLVDIMDIINGILGSLVSITAGCFLYNSWDSLLIGAVGALISCVAMPLIDRLGVDDPVGASAVHGASAIWGVCAVGLFADNPIPLDTTSYRSGLFKGGGWYLFGVQSLSALCLSIWSFFSTVLMLWVINFFIPIRLEYEEELLGADITEHKIRHPQAGVSRAVSVLDNYSDRHQLRQLANVGLNPGHVRFLENFFEDKLKKKMQTNEIKKNNQKNLHNNNNNNNNMKQKQNINNKNQTRTMNNKKGSSIVPLEPASFAWID